MNNTNFFIKSNKLKIDIYILKAHNEVKFN